MEHGHGLLIQALEQLRPEWLTRGGITVLEVGSSREPLPNQDSTRILARFCQERDWRFTTCDMIASVAQATGLRYANLRYFNVAGAAAPELADTGCANLVPMVLERITSGQRPRIFGDDYDTPDGTCVRDYIHVSDIASAHAAAAARLGSGDLQAVTLNIGRGEGVSVREMVELIRTATGTAGDPASEPVVEPRRAGDPARIVASAEAIAQVLGWRARHDVQEMVASAWEGWQARSAT